MSRAARARAVLHAAEQLHGVRRLTLVPASAAPVPTESKPSESKPTELKSAGLDSSGLPSSTSARSGFAAQQTGGDWADGFSVPAAFGQLLPHGLPRGVVCSVHGSTALLLALAAAVSAQNGWVAFVGMGDLNFVAATDLGLDLGRVVVVPEPGGQVPEVLASLIDGMDLVVTTQRVGVTSGQQTRLSARAKQRGTTLLIAGDWPQARIRLSGQAGDWQGVDRGLGRLTTCAYRLHRGTATHGMQRVDVQLHNGRFQNATAQQLPMRMLA